MKVLTFLALWVTLFHQGYSNSLDTCVGRCGYGTDNSFSCQCNPSCERFKDCCSDYTDVCKTSALSCKGRCDEQFNSQNKCHCNSKCAQHQNCCSDYADLCDMFDQRIKSLSEALYALDSNKASSSELIINPQALVHDSQTSSKKDLSSENLFRYLNEEVLFSRPTYTAFLAVLDNYNRMTVGPRAVCFPYTKGVYASEEEFLQDLKMMWFGLYSRNNNKKDSSGFEHIFAGEIKGGKVSGFHNWIQFYLLEKRGKLNYYSHSFNGPWTSYPDVLGMQFMWEGYFKQVGSAVIGCSPEFDFALYSLCYITRPGEQCRLSLGGKQLMIQTYTWENSFYGDGKKYIGSAFPATPRK
ncbi:Poly(U)-specific endoribonuclease [Dissostichus eleginoides]|uniref:Uridylate-specific endoribonuclease n=1 Tax=Dissostichus eleginoides TaxID=100907 RepID=A0AAD9CM99_DISEL|nr:Poly(U)-specific endoribonuclease [Dissostichus eleginoides]